MKRMSCQKKSGAWTVIGIVAAVIAVGAAAYWLLCAKKKKAAALCEGDDEPIPMTENEEFTTEPSVYADDDRPDETPAPAED